ncbi:MAG TPA: hypothetical protein VGV35_07760, partial [Bryobacteraceae bacterium]|nr:hypothetical protein [Bryobacteraceae bacterium]
RREGSQVPPENAATQEGLMFRWLYVWLLRLHPAPFRQRFGDEMLQIFDSEAGLWSAVALLADGLLSVVRQWTLRPDFRRPLLVEAISDRAADVPLFRTIDDYKPKPIAMFQGGLLTVVVLYAVAAAFAHGGKTPVFLIGVHHPSPHLLPVDRSSVAESELNTTVKIPPIPEDPWRAIAKVYFKALRVLDALDANQDLVISPWEIVTAPGALRKLDTNHDGKLSAEECGFSLGANPRVPPDLVNRARLEFMRENPVLAALDVDHDGEISASEIANSSAALRTLDRNGDGSLTPDELIPEREATQAATIMLRLDKNSDGSISRTELESDEAEPLRELILSADRNHDGVTTKDELVRELRLRTEKKRAFDDARHRGGFQ